MAALASLMGAKNKTTVNDLFNHTFRHRDNLNLAPLDTIGSELGIKASEVLPVLEAAREVIKKSLYKASGEVDYNAIVNNCDPSLDDRLKKLIAKVVGANLMDWKKIASQQIISWPRMVDMDWRVDVMSSSQEVSRMSVPTVILDIKVEGQQERVGEMPPVRSINFELSKESLGTLLDGMNKIREQLGALSDQ